jgi:phosphomannomutase/phosphoglucomutase
MRIPKLHRLTASHALLAGAVLAVVAGLVVSTGRAPEAPGDRSQAAADLAAALGQALAAELATLRTAVEQAQPAAALASADPRALGTTEAKLGRAHPDVMRVWLLPPGFDRPDYASHPPLTYASLSLVQRSEQTRGPVPPEAQMLGTDQAQIALPVAVRASDGALAGHVLFSLNPAAVRRTLDGVPWPGGYAEIVQPVGTNEVVALASRGTPGSAGPASALDLPGTGWRLRYTPAAAPGGVPTGGIPGGWLVVGGGALLLGAGALYYLRQRRPAPRRAGRVPPVVTTASTDTVHERPSATVAREESLGPPPLPSVEEISAVEAAEATAEPEAQHRLVEPPPASIFLAYDIRGLVGETLAVDSARALGLAIGSEAHARGQQTLVVGRDGRLSSPELSIALVEGLVQSGRDVIDLGQVPTPVVYFASDFLETHSGVVVTASHNPPAYNGFKVFLGDEPLALGALTALRDRLVRGELTSGQGSVQSFDISAEYIRRVTEDIPAAVGSPFTLVVDCANGVAGDLAPRLYRALGHDVVELNCAVDGTFPGHDPDPTQPENLIDLSRAVREHNAHLGFAFDGDGDRLVVVDGQGRTVWPDRLLMLLASDILPRHPGATVLCDVKCTARLGRLVESLGGKTEMWRSGHSLMKARIRETGSVLAGEGSGHLYIRDRWYGFDDALYAGARVLEILRARGEAPTAVFEPLLAGKATAEIRIPMPAEQAAALLQRLSAEAFPGARATTRDGLRVDYPDRWGLVRASNTTPHLTLRFEGDDEGALARIQAEFRRALLAVEPRLALPF